MSVTIVDIDHAVNGLGHGRRAVTRPCVGCDAGQHDLAILRVDVDLRCLELVVCDQCAIDLGRDHGVLERSANVGGGVL